MQTLKKTNIIKNLDSDFSNLIIRLRKQKTAQIKELMQTLNKTDLEIWDQIISQNNLRYFKVLDFDKSPKETRISLTKYGTITALFEEGILLGIFRGVRC